MTGHPVAVDAATRRSYGPQDLAACMALFDGNTPAFFDVSERADFHAFLLEHARDWRFEVIERGGQVVACGGLRVEDGGTAASFAWGMVDNRLHGLGLGRQLTQARLARARATPGVREVRLSTSQHTQGFYAAFGFKTVAVRQDGYGPGLDAWDMVLALLG